LTCKLSFAGPVAERTLECYNAHKHRHCTITLQRRKCSKNIQKCNQNNYKFLTIIIIIIITTIITSKEIGVCVATGGRFRHKVTI